MPSGSVNVQQGVSDNLLQHCTIVGKTNNGNAFRPSDWADRLCGHLSTFRNRRIYYSPLLKPAVIEGIKCVIVDASLEELHPKVYQMVMDFCRTNSLQIK